VPHFCHQISYTSSAWTRILANNDRFAAVRAPIECLGGTLHAAFFAIDSFDVLIITEFPDHISDTEIAVQFFASGDVATIHSTRLLDASGVLQAMRNAGHYSYQSIPRAQALSAAAP
jgi:uncharacterized protein with GYD domain